MLWFCYCGVVEMIGEMILSDIASVVGYNFIIVFLFIFTIFLFLINRFAGVTSLIVSFVLTMKIFTDNTVNNVQLIPESFLITTVIILGLLIGFMFYMVFIKD